MLKINITLFLCLLFNSNLVFSHEKIKNQTPISIFYLNIPVQTLSGDEIIVGAQYRIPKERADDPIPAVIILHSSGGVDKTGSFYAKALNNNGIATLELDMWGGRDLSGGTDGRVGLPFETLPDVYSALKLLADKPEIDATKIGVIGFSWGGVLSLLTASENYMSMSGSDYRFAGHVAHYPSCWVYNRDIPFLPRFEFNNLTGSPVLIQVGGFDDYDEPSTCQNMVESLSAQDQHSVSVNFFPRAYHAWDRLEPELTVTDVFSHQGTGGLVTMKPNRRIAGKSKRKVVQFFNNLFY